MADASEKSQAPTPRRRQQAREAGQVAQSQDLGSAVLLLGTLALVLMAGGGLLSFLVELLGNCLGGQAWQAGLDRAATRESLADQWQLLVMTLGQRLMPVLAGATVLALAAHWLQTGFLFTPGRLLPDFARVSPGKGFSRLWSGDNLARLLFGLFKVTVVAAVGLFGLWSRREALADLSGYELTAMASRAWDICLGACVEMGAALVALAALDYLYQRWRLERSLRMTPQEVREEMRELQGDPQIAARRRELGRRRLQPSDRRATARSQSQIGAVDSV